MADDPTRDFLAALPQLEGFIRGKPPGTVAIARSVILEQAEEAERDFDAVAAWIDEHGGRLVKPPPVQSQTQRGGRRTEMTVPGDTYYVIPTAALTGP
jgi:hypothetical protein